MKYIFIILEVHSDDNYVVHGEVGRMNELKKGLERDLIPENARLEVSILSFNQSFARFLPF